MQTKEIGIALNIDNENHIEVMKLLEPLTQSPHIHKVHLVLFAYHTRASAFCEWFVSLANGHKIRTRFMPDYNTSRAIDWIESSHWFPCHIPIVFIEAYGIVKITETMHVLTFIKPHYCKNFANIKVIDPHDFCIQVSQVIKHDTKAGVETLEKILFTKREKLFQQKDLQELMFLCSVHAYYLKKFELGKKCCQWILENLGGAENYHRFSTDNQQHYNNIHLSNQ